MSALLFAVVVMLERTLVQRTAAPATRRRTRITRARHLTVVPTPKPLALTPVAAPVKVPVDTPVDTPVDEVLRCGDLVLDIAAHQAFAGGAPLALSHLQFVVLAHLVRRAGRVVGSDELSSAAADVVPPTTRTIASAVSRLRGHLGAGPARPVINVSRARGYQLVGPSAA